MTEYDLVELPRGLMQVICTISLWTVTNCATSFFLFVVEKLQLRRLQSGAGIWLKSSAGWLLWTWGSCVMSDGLLPYLYALCKQRADRVEHGQHHDADVRENRQPHIGDAQGAEGQAHCLDRQRKGDVLPDDAHAPA